MNNIKRCVKKVPWLYRLLKPIKDKFFPKKKAGRGAPSWFRDSFYEEDLEKIRKGGKNFLYVPWIEEHGNVLINKIDSNLYELIAFHLMRRDLPSGVRRKAFNFARNSPDVYRKMVLRKLLPVKDDISGFIVTFDWAPVMRIIVSVCHELDIPVILIPHESVFVDRDKYYWDPVSQASVPTSDFILCWGKLQKDIFEERGYPAEQIKIVGAPKFDTYYNYAPMLSRKQFARVFGLDESKKIILFASQPLDSQYDIEVARDSQKAAIKDIYDWCNQNNCQLIVRLPPSKDNILGKELYDEIASSSFAALDDANYYTVTPEEALYHSDIVTSVNSTMLFEGVLLGKVAVSTKYIDFDQIWERAGIPSASGRSELFSVLSEVLVNGFTYKEDGLKWAKEQFSYGEFSGRACEHIRDWLIDFVSDTKNTLESSTKELVKPNRYDVVAVYDSSDVKALNEKNVSYRTAVCVESQDFSIKYLASVDAFFISDENDEQQSKYLVRQAKKLGRPVIRLSEE